MHRGGKTTSMQIFLVISTGFLYLVAAGLFSRGVWYFEANTWNKVIGGDAAETGSGAGSYDMRQSVWHVNCCNPELGGGGGWGIFNALLGWTNSATYGSVISYNLYWVCVIVGYGAMIYREKRGPLPVIDVGLSRFREYKRRAKAFILRSNHSDAISPPEGVSTEQSGKEHSSSGGGTTTIVSQSEV